MTRLILLSLFLIILLPLHAEPVNNFAIPKEGYHFSFPRDYGSHDDFKIEWWYITGHLFTKEGERFAFESTFFRTALFPPYKQDKLDFKKEIDFDKQTLFFADMALLNVKNQIFLYQRRWNRRGWDASASSKKLDLRNGNWSLTMDDPPTETMHLSGSVLNTASFELTFRPLKPLVVFGNNSISRKGEDDTALSYYMTFPRLQVEGRLLIGEGDQEKKVYGEAWMDHEISSSQLASNQVGWDWCSLQLKDGREIMAYRMRRADGTQDPFSSITWIDPQGRLTSYHGKEFSIEPLRIWKSPHTQIRYPISMRLCTKDPITKKPIVFLLLPLGEDQELAGNHGLSYWEGGCRVLDINKQEIGSAFLELTGYDTRFQKNLH